MSQAHVDWWLRGAEAWNRGDREAWLNEIPPEWEFQASGVFPGLKPVYRGRAGAVELWEAMRGPWKEFDLSVERVEDLDDRLLALVTFEVRGRDGLKTSRRWGYVVTFRDDGSVRTENFESWQGALEAAGLPA